VEEVVEEVDLAAEGVEIFQLNPVFQHLLVVVLYRTNMLTILGGDQGVVVERLVLVEVMVNLVMDL